MSVARLLDELLRLGIGLKVDRPDLAVSAPRGALTPELRARIKDNKAALIELLSGSARSALRLITPSAADRNLPFPLTDLQQAYWLGRQQIFELSGVACQAYLEVDCPAVDLERLAEAWRRTIERHDMLRAVVLRTGQQQILAQVPRYEIAVTDLSDVSAEAAEAHLASLRAELSHEVGDATRWPLFALRASRLAGGRVRLHFRMELIVADAWSFWIVMNDWAQLYDEPGRALAPLGVSFRDYVLAGGAQQRGDAYRDARAYWHARIDTLPPAPPLPLATSPSRLSPPRFRRRAVELEEPLWSRLKERARVAGLTPSGLLCAVFAEVLAAWSGSSRFTLNLTVFNREPLHPDIERIVGDFASVLLLEVDGGKATFLERARALQAQLSRDLDHSAYGGVQVIRELHRRDGDVTSARAPVVFTSMLFGVGPDGAPIERMGELVYAVSQTPQVWLDHQVSELRGRLLVTWDAVDGLFPPGLLEDMLEAERGLLARLAADDEACWSSGERAVLGERQREQRAAANATAAPLPEGLLQSGFWRRAEATPARPAVIGSGRTLTYGELGSLARRLGRHLRARGALPETLVAVVLEKGWEQVAAVLGVLESGAAYVPIDPDLPDKRRHYLLDNAGASLAVTTARLDQSLSWPAGVRRVVLEGREVRGESDEPLAAVHGPDALAYVIYTSGSTGEPKGVMIEHLAAHNTIVDVNARLRIGAGDRVLALSALSFDLSVYDVFGILAAGGAVVLPDVHGTKDPGHWIELITREHVTVWNTVPALLEMLVEHSDAATLPTGTLSTILLSGDWIPVSLPGRIAAVAPEARVYSLGGATEASIWSIVHPIEEVDPAWKSIPYGRPMANQRWAVLDASFEPSPVWVPGQLHIGGAGLARGYWRDEERTRERFVHHPRTGERLYRTGDMGRYLPDGTIEFLGRQDFQVKVGGHRIELGEIEAALREHPGVRAAVADAVGEPRGTRRLRAYVVVGDGGPDREGLRTFLRARLPAYAVPADFVLVDELPRTTSGKVDRKMLRARTAAMEGADRETATAGREVVAPRTELERTLAAVWCEVLGVESAGIHDNFFDAGGDSLRLVQVDNRVREALGVRVPMASFMEKPTIANLVACLRGDVPEAAPAPPSRPEDLAVHVALDPSIAPSAPVTGEPRPRHLFFTGATGFIGAFVLHELFTRTDARVTCLVRAGDEAAGRERIRRNLEGYDVWEASFAGRFDVVCGDLAQPRLGMDEAAYAAVAEATDAVLHNGAQVHFGYPYRRLEAANVRGTASALEMACTGRTKPFHMMSTVSVFPADGDGRVVYETDSLDHTGPLLGGYAQTKWVAEKLAVVARERDLPVTVYRPGLVAGHSVTGVCNTDELICRIIAGCVALGCAPRLDTRVDVTPVDYVSRAVVSLMADPQSRGGSFHLVHPDPPHWDDIVEALRSLGYTIAVVDAGQWRDAALSAATAPAHPLHGLLPLLAGARDDGWASAIQMPRFDCTRALGALGGDRAPPAVGRKLLGTYVGYFARVGLVQPAPAEVAWTEPAREE